jgi:hypothetical protein
MRARVFVVFILVFVLLAGISLSAQTFRGAINGTVIDTTGASIADANVKATEVGTGLVREAVSGPDGNYNFSELPLGDYTITVTKQGFRTETAAGIHVGVGAPENFNVTLTPGRVEEKVEVQAQVPLVESTNDNLGGIIEGAQATELPVNGRDFTKLLVLVPGATADPSLVEDSPGSFGSFSVNGGRGRSNNYLLDGTDMNDGFRNDPAINEGGVFGVPATLLPVDAIAEFGVLASTEAEYGRNSGSIVNIVTKSGSNALHGGVFEDFRNSALDARNYFNCSGSPCAGAEDVPATPQDLFHNNQFGGSLGGPIIKDHTFFFAAYEGQREHVASPAVASVPTQAGIALDTPAGGINPVIQGILALNPWGALPAGTPGSDAPVTNQLTVGAQNRLDSVIGKIDQHIGPNDLLTGRYFFGDSSQSFPLSLVSLGSELPGFNTIVPTRVQVVSLSFTHVISPRLLMEVRGGWNRFAETFSPEDSTFDPASVGLETLCFSTPCPASSSNPKLFGLPQIFVDGSTADPTESFASLGASGSVPRGRVDTNWQYMTNFSYTMGRHSWKTGFEFRRTSINSFLDGSFRGSLSFDTLSDFLSGVPTGGGSDLSGNTHRFTHQDNFGLYLQDSFRATHRLTFNYGLRWDYFGVVTEKHDNFSIFNISTASIQQVGTPGLSQLYPSNYRNFSPRLSFAYDVSGSGKTVVRAGWSLAYDSFSQDYFLDQSAFNLTNLGPAYNDVGSSPIVPGGLNTAYCATPPCALTAGQPVYTPGTAANTVFSVDQRLRTPYSEQYNLNIQEQLGPRMALQVGYVGTQGHRLFRFLDINQPSFSGVYPYPAFGPIDQFESTAYSNYNSLQTNLNFRSYHGFTSTINYTWSHSIDNASDGFDYVPNATQPDNSFNPNAERANSNFDTRNRFSWLYTYQFPNAARGGKFTSGWAIDGVVSLMNGMPFNVITLSDFNGLGEGYERPDLVGNPFAGTHTPDLFLNASAFAAPCEGNFNGTACNPGTAHFGDLGRNAFNGPHYLNWDFALSKTTSLTERVKMEIRADFFNFLNHPNFSNPVLPNGFVDYATNGVNANGQGIGFIPITATPDVGSENPYLGGGGPRNIQIAAKFNF